ncbi:MAG: hypothetical protein KDB22_08200 [Planctomycetales bacterium]|nr:hypothetical protein [Planctomycetales bacterium]
MDPPILNMDKIFRSFENHHQAERAALEDDQRLDYRERFQAFMQLMAPFYAASSGFQRIYRVDDLKQRKIRDDWRLRPQPVPESPRDG